MFRRLQNRASQTLDNADSVLAALYDLIGEVQDGVSIGIEKDAGVSLYELLTTKERVEFKFKLRITFEEPQDNPPTDNTDQNNT